MSEAWTTSLGRELQLLQSEGATDQQLFALEGRLQEAFDAVKHVRKCYNKPSSHLHPVES